MITEADLSNWRLGLQIIKQLIDERQKSFSDRPFLAARRHSRASFSLASFMETLTEGYPNLVFLRELLKRVRIHLKSLNFNLKPYLTLNTLHLNFFTSGEPRWYSRRSTLGFRVLGFRVLGFRLLGFRVLGLGFDLQGFGFRVWPSGFRVQGLGFDLQGLGFWV